MLPEADADTIDRLMDLYADDPLLGPALAEAVKVDEIAGDNKKPTGQPVCCTDGCCRASCGNRWRDRTLP